MIAGPLLALALAAAPPSPADGGPGDAPVRPLAGVRVMIDPGHPSEVGPGTRGATITELEACWRVGLALRGALERDGATVRLTKATRDELVRNRRRAELANAFRAHAMVRLHCDAAPERGFAVFYPDRPGTAQGVTGPSAAVIAASRELARSVHAGLREAFAGELPDRGLRTDRQTAIGARQGALTGSVFSEVPVVLIEMVTLTQPADDRWMAQPKNQRRYAEALAAGLRAHLAPPARR